MKNVKRFMYLRIHKHPYLLSRARSKILYADTVVIEVGETLCELKQNVEDDLRKLISWPEKHNLTLNMGRVATHLWSECG